jgi:predicted AAA+ superfamily ATPase
VPEIQQALHANIGWQSILAYLKFLDGALLLRLIPSVEMRLKKQRALSKICLCDHALRASWLQEIVPLDPRVLAEQPHLSDIAGRIAESAAGYFLASISHLDVAHFPERGAEPEVDYVLTVGAVRIPLEIKYRLHINPHDDTRGLRAFLEKTVYNAPFGILVTMQDGVSVPDPRILTLSLSTLLWMR